MRLEFLGCVLACCVPAAAETSAPQMPVVPAPPAAVPTRLLPPEGSVPPAAPAPEPTVTPPPAAAPAPPPADTHPTALKPSSPSRMISTSESVKFVPSGERRALFFVASVYPDCSSTGKTIPRLQIRPAHGEISFVYTDGFTAFRQGTAVAHCSAIRVPGMEIQYQSAPDYLGDDAFEVLLLYPLGQAEIQRYDVIVK